MDAYKSDKDGVNNWLCFDLPDDREIWFNSYTDEQVLYFSLQKCINKPDCKSEQEINAFMKNEFSVLLYYNDMQMELKDHKY